MWAGSKEKGQKTCQAKPACLLCVKDSTVSGAERNTGVDKTNSSTQEALSFERETRRELIIVECQCAGQGTKETGRDR